ncbi:cobalt-precorrin-5B (C(1))-methyltransferase CbiD [Leptolyngbya sp. PCC 6406]|uniref:cobalt-precorrin-5B (C(1))-methyltransferase CbiD n=1 Tax=Leptolyngbya sp. PCC 6406 TaxID=1173264 RepID=UPI0002AD0CD7|nr:cobalt-precorrin-5B (C(1))-methyltransferase CbiD [Leptolyngbya sp. PCC 6406]
MMTAPRSGYTLPVFACASAIAALRHLQDPQDSPPGVTVNLLEPPEQVDIPIEQIATLPDGSALAITRSDPGDNLDLTRHTPIWTVVAWGGEDQADPLEITGGEGVGRQVQAGDRPAIYAYAQRLFQANLTPLLRSGQKIRVTVILPEGRALAERTSNAAFGVVEGLSLLGTTGISQPLSAPGQLEVFRQSLREKATQFDTLVFCVGENGLDKALSLGIPPEQRVKTANWLGPLLVEAALSGVTAVLLLGYHGKLIKLAGGIFHTHHHVADGRQEILTAIAAAQGLPTPAVQTLLQSATVEAGLAHLRHLDTTQGSDWVERIYGDLVTRVDRRAAIYAATHCGDQRRTSGHHPLLIGTAMFDRGRDLIAVSDGGRSLLPQLW